MAGPLCFRCFKGLLAAMMSQVSPALAQGTCDATCATCADPGASNCTSCQSGLTFIANNIQSQNLTLGRCSTTTLALRSTTTTHAPTPAAGRPTQGVTVTYYLDKSCSRLGGIIQTSGVLCEQVNFDSEIKYGTFSASAFAAGTVRVCNDAACASCQVLVVQAANACGSSLGLATSDIWSFKHSGSVRSVARVLAAWVTIAVLE